MHEEFIKPMKRLMLDDQVVGFITHCGSNSMLEAIQYGTPMIGLPVATDQFGGCYKMERMGYGISLRTNPSADKMLKAIQKI